MTEEAARHEISRLKRENENLRSLYNNLVEVDRELMKTIHEQIIADSVRQARTIMKVERALGIKLHDWIKVYIFATRGAEEMVPDGRRFGRTTARALRLALSDGEPLTIRTPIDLEPYAGEDAISTRKLQHFWNEFLHIYRTLKDAGGIELREIKRR